MKIIGQFAFADCKFLTELITVKGIERIDQGAFMDCVLLPEIKLDKGIDRIAMFTFKGCAALKRVKIPQGVRWIETMAFAFCTSLQDIEVKRGVEAIFLNAFEGCTNLKTLTLPIEPGIRIDRDVFSSGQHRLHCPMQLDTLRLTCPQKFLRRNPRIQYFRFPNVGTYGGHPVDFINDRIREQLRPEVQVLRSIWAFLHALKRAYGGMLYDQSFFARISSFWFLGRLYKNSFPLRGAGAFRLATKDIDAWPAQVVEEGHHGDVGGSKKRGRSRDAGKNARTSVKRKA